MKRAKNRKSKIGAIVYWSFLLVWVALLVFASTYIWKDAKRFGEYWEAAQIDPKLNAYMDRLSVEMWQDGENSVMNTVSQMEHPYQTDEECLVVLRGMLRAAQRSQHRPRAPRDKYLRSAVRKLQAGSGDADRAEVHA